MANFLKYVAIELVEDYELGIVTEEQCRERLVTLVGEQESARLLASAVPGGNGGHAGAGSAASAGVEGVEGTDVRIPSGGTELLGYLARPAQGGSYPGLIAIHENRGLVEHTRDCARRLASAGYLVLAPDLLSRQGGTASLPDEDARIAALGQADRDAGITDLLTALGWLSGRPGTGPLGVTGWCMGGGYAWGLAVAAGDLLKAAVPWYGPVPSSVAGLRAAVFAIYGELDQRINAGIDPITDAMAREGLAFSKKVYPGANHAFNNNTNPGRYSPEQAPIAWQDMLDFFAGNLR